MIKYLNSFFELLLFSLLILISVLLAVGGNYSSAVLSGINLWIACVLPSLFPYFFITAILSGLKVTGKVSSMLTPFTRALFNTGGATGYAFMMSVISGYPMGAKIVSDLKNSNLITKSESVRAAAFCSTSSPMFILGSVGNIMFGSPSFGVLLFLVHILSATSVGFIFSFYKRSDKPQNTNTALPLKSTDNVLYESAYSAVISVLIVGSLITVFYLLTEILLSLNLLTPIINALYALTGDINLSSGIVLGAFECTRGLKVLSKGKITFLTLPVCAAICGFGGLSVMMQSLAYLKKAKIKTAPFVLSKLLSAVLNFLIGTIFSLFIF
ncbi:MAG: hypothetical protein IJV95_01310 [Clostridia bacterium]|nr:hypothetical protein [Clostridia bacterium]